MVRTNTGGIVTFVANQGNSRRAEMKLIRDPVRAVTPSLYVESSISTTKVTANPVPAFRCFFDLPPEAFNLVRGEVDGDVLEAYGFRRFDHIRSMVEFRGPLLLRTVAGLALYNKTRA